MEELATRLRQTEPALHDRFGVASIGIILSPAPHPSPIRLTVRFHVTPDLEHFFVLEQHLCDLLQFTVDLTPERALGGEATVRWL